MTADGGDLRSLLHLLADPDRRADAAVALATAFGASRVLLYVKDPQLSVLLPAVGMPKTQGGGALWRAFLRRCLREPRPRDLVDLPPGPPVEACAVCAGGAALVVLGAGEPPALQALAPDFPLLAAALVAQQALQIGRAEAAEARGAAAQAHDLAKALDRARAAAADLNLQLRNEHERKDEFLAMLAHELRNPLAPLVNSIELLRRSGAGEQVGRPLEVMARQLQQLTRLVDDLLDVSRVSRGLIELRRERVPLAEVLDDALEIVRPMLDERGHQLQRSAVAPELTVLADRVRLTQVFANLLGNAAKYTDPGGRITLSVVEDQRRASVVVQDNGIGIPREMLSRVFEMFAQVPAAQARSQGGLGIGLTLAKRLVELHGGRISAYSRGEAQGSTFTVSLPQVVSAAGPAAPQQRRQSRPSGRQPRVLVVDDNRDGADTMVALLAALGAQARAAYDSMQALEQASRFDPHLVLLDIGLPDVDGYETARRLRRIEGLHARLVALTGYGAAADRQRAMDAGFDEHQVKPLAPEALQDLLLRLDASHPAS